MVTVWIFDDAENSGRGGVITAGSLTVDIIISGMVGVLVIILDSRTFPLVGLVIVAKFMLIISSLKVGTIVSFICAPNTLLDAFNNDDWVMVPDSIFVVVIVTESFFALDKDSVRVTVTVSLVVLQTDSLRRVVNVSLVVVLVVASTLLVMNDDCVDDSVLLAIDILPLVLVNVDTVIRL